MTNVVTDKVILEKDIPDTATCACPLKRFQQRYLVKGCLNCEYFKGVSLMTEANEVEIKEPLTGIVKGLRKIEWHEKYMIRCAFPTSRRCNNISVVEEN